MYHIPRILFDGLSSHFLMAVRAYYVFRYKSLYLHYKYWVLQFKLYINMQHLEWLQFEPNCLGIFFSLITLQVRAIYCVSFNSRNQLWNDIHFRIFNDNLLWQTHANQYRIVGWKVGWLHFTVEVIIEIRCPRPRFSRVLPYNRTSS